jgi:broad specificity phosphatase PhoE
LRTITLVRHGTPDWDFRTPIPGAALAHWLEGERAAALATTQRPSAELSAQVRHAGCVVVSPLRRSIESARAVAPGVDPIVDECFTEPALPSAPASASRLRFRPGVWTWLARSAWFCGWSRGVETFRAARARASRAAGTLAALATEHGDVVLIGHGLMNILIAAELRRLGWRGPRFPRPRHWAFAVYRRA